MRRLYSILGLIPLFVFVPLHAVQKMGQFITGKFQDTPIILMLLFGLLPFAAHAVLGICIIAGNRACAAKKTRGVMFRIQMASSFAILVFVPLHIFLFHTLRYSPGLLVFYASVAAFTAGIAAFAFHMGYGAYTFCLTWGIIQGTKSRKTVRMAAVFLGLALGAGGLVLAAFMFGSIKKMLSL
jgi:succinate dehydrogenase / fumarate reductase cytochrome b subunit